MFSLLFPSGPRMVNTVTGSASEPCLLPAPALGEACLLSSRQVRHQLRVLRTRESGWRFHSPRRTSWASRPDDSAAHCKDGQGVRARPELHEED